MYNSNNPVVSSSSSFNFPYVPFDFALMWKFCPYVDVCRPYVEIRCPYVEIRCPFVESLFPHKGARFQPKGAGAWFYYLYLLIKQGCVCLSVCLSVQAFLIERTANGGEKVQTIKCAQFNPIFPKTRKF